MKKRYLGDSVYASTDRFMVKLTTDNGVGATNTIYMDESVIESFLRWLEEVRKAKTEEQKL